MVNNTNSIDGKFCFQILEYNVPNGKMTRARDLVNAYKQLVPPEQLTKEKIRLARIVGWCIEMVSFMS